MLSHLYHILNQFRSQFSRRRSWLMFCVVILGFIAASSVEGITTFCRVFHFGEPGYHALLHFFRCNSWNLNALTLFWAKLVLSQGLHLKVDKRIVMLGDHILIPKDGRKMPGVVNLRQDSETQSKPSHFRGHRWSALGVVLGSWAQSVCVPLSMRLHQGFAHLGPQNQEDTPQNQEDTPQNQEQSDQDHTQEQSDQDYTLGQRMILMAVNLSMELSQPTLLVLDAFFSIGCVFDISSRFMLYQYPFLTVLTRAKKHYVAYSSPPPRQPNKVGRPPKYGKKLKLYDEFKHPDKFTKAEALLYGKTESFSYKAETLLWKPVDQMLLFIWVNSRHGKMVLMCNDLTLDPIKAIECYCLRFRIEVMFGWLSQWLSAFAYRFWSKFLPRHSRRPIKNSQLQAPPIEKQEVVKKVWEAYERYVMLACIALGLLKLVALKFPQQVWGCFRWFLRSRSRELPSARTAQMVLACQIQDDFRDVAPHAIMAEIRGAYTQPDPPFLEHTKTPMEEIT